MLIPLQKLGSLFVLKSFLPIYSYIIIDTFIEKKIKEILDQLSLNYQL